MNKKRILFIKPWNGSSFIEQDVRILRKHFVVNEVHLWPLQRLLSILTIIMSRKIDAVFVWFAFWWACPIVLASRLSRIKVILIPSGVDVADYPEIEYGKLGDLKTRIMVKFALNNADLVLPVSNFIRREVLKFSRPRRMKVIYNGVDVQKFKCVINEKLKENIVLTVGAVNTMNLKYKRLDLFVDCARYLPQVKFTIIGSLEDEAVAYLKQRASSNVSFAGFLSEDDLIRYYSRAKLYAQFSHAEAFGCALVEAMACECIPVVVDRGALSEIVGDVGFYAHYNDPESIAHAIQNALDSGDRNRIRDRVKGVFSLEKRETELRNALNEMFKN